MEIHFGPFALNRDTRQLTRDGSPVHLSRKAFDLLVMLVAERPKVVPKAALQEGLWPGTFVVEANLSNLIAEIRGALGDTSRPARFIRTSHGFGYAFCGDVDAAPPAAAAAAPPNWTTGSWLECQGRRIPLMPGDNVIGRDSDVTIVIVDPTVSRRHARVLVTPDGVSVEDFGSKNGTFVGGAAVTSPVRLAHGDEIQIGTVPVRFYVRSDEPATESAVRTPDRKA